MEKAASYLMYSSSIVELFIREASAAPLVVVMSQLAIRSVVIVLFSVFA